MKADCLLTSFSSQDAHQTTLVNLYPICELQNEWFYQSFAVAS